MIVSEKLNMKCEDVTDWHIDITKPVDQSVAFPGQVRVNGEMIPYAEELKKLLVIESKTRNRFLIKHNNLRYRADLAYGGMFTLRKIGAVPRYDDLLIHSAFQQMLLGDELHEAGGLLLISGPAGSGKTTTACATIHERLYRNGGYCLTLEDPPEYEMQGFHGERGYCNQVDVTDIGWSNGIAGSLRNFPSKTSSILFVGEIRTPEGARELLQNAISGHLIISTVHGNDLQESILRLLALARTGGEREAKYLLSASLKLVINQTIGNNGMIRMKALEVDKTVASIIQNSRDLNLVDSIRRTEKKVEAMHR